MKKNLPYTYSIDAGENADCGGEDKLGTGSHGELPEGATSPRSVTSTHNHSNSILVVTGELRHHFR